MPHEHIQSREIDDRFIISGLLGEGGSKTVFDTVINGKRRALAIPNSIDDPDTQAEKWNSVLQEPENAKLLSELGLLTIPEYEIIVATINGRELPALSMTPFSDLPFRVFDSKDGTQTYTHGPLSHIEHFSDISSYITGFGADIATLTQSGIVLSRDSISFAALPDGSMRLFFYDLQDMTINNSTNKDNLRAGYSGIIVSTLDNIFDYQQLRRFEEQGYDFRERMDLSQKLQAIANLTFYHCLTQSV